MRDNVTIEAVSNQSGDVPNQSGVLLETLPEAPNIEAEAVKVVSKKVEEAGK